MECDVAMVLTLALGCTCHDDPTYVTEVELVVVAVDVAAAVTIHAYAAVLFDAVDHSWIVVSDVGAVAVAGAAVACSAQELKRSNVGSLMDQMLRFEGSLLIDLDRVEMNLKKNGVDRSCVAAAAVEEAVEAEEKAHDHG